MSNIFEKILGRQDRFEGYLFDDELPKVRLRELKHFCREHGVSLADLSLIDQALTHTSFAHESEQEMADYERLEFLGDSVIGLFIVEHLYNSFPAMNEITSDVVSQAALSDAATKLGLNRLLNLGKGEVLSRGRRKPSILSDTFEALVGALYLSSTLEETKEFVINQLEERIQDVVSRGNLENYKSLLQRAALERFGENPSYRVLSRTGPQHSAVFVVGVEIKGNLYGKGRGRSKKDAEMQAANKTLQTLRSKKRPRT